ncbi:MAG: PilZ domain-containing protein [Rhodospirillales bacterium]|nr:PilZ domain-containing protein [Rhodospirillales bacterium]
MVFHFDNLREHERKGVLFSTEIVFGDKTISCEVTDVSNGGIRARAAWALPRGERVRLKMDKLGDFSAIVVWVRDGELGLKFDDDPERVANMMMMIATYGGN